MSGSLQGLERITKKPNSGKAPTSDAVLVRGVFLLLEFDRRLLFAGRTILLHSLNMVLPGLAQFILLVETHCGDGEPVHRAEAGEYDALTARHSEGSIRIYKTDASYYKTLKAEGLEGSEGQEG